ncbi:amino acid ABC transporter membrane protein 1, PAAT family [Streptomyces sp. DvalAA-14]|uniref:amino acid ABC transporter permease n=1 Tax=unclassified Streptomyces TaxID=2593676 RepID=UPI00081B36DC|nr:amino acid ABC transporter permease [Streptomyces sp. DvalAA-14]MYS24301.1 ABC transporter permease subunit [Streptomyces sp. SID4948]SCE44778.1 amino acid ABC transporter membrane protein 1, PAAT family [Streptomyces sp. DvalAA-14]
MSALTQHLPELTDGLLSTLLLMVLSFVGALVVGLLVAAARVSPVASLRGAALAYVELFQNIPLLAWLLLFVFALPEAGIIFPLFTTAVIVLSLYEAAYTAEAIRTGINSVNRGQAEAARALGLTTAQNLRHVVLPQALRAVVQPLSNVFIALTMNTSLAAAVGVVELTHAANNVNLAEAQPIPIFVGAGVAYMALALILGLSGGFIERKVAIVR